MDLRFQETAASKGRRKQERVLHDGNQRGETIMNRIKGMAVGSVVFLLVLAASSLPAQQDELDIDGLSIDHSALREYSWSMRTAVTDQDKEASVKVDKMRYDLDGNLQVTPLGGSGQLSPERQQFIEELIQFALEYAQPDAQKFVAFVARADQWEGRGKNLGITRIEGEDFLYIGDSVQINARNGSMDKGRFTSSLDGAYVVVEADYRTLPEEGPRYVARLTAKVPSEALELTIENFDYIRNAPVAAGDILTLSDGTELLIRLLQPLSSAEQEAGQAFEGTMDRDVMVQGQRVITRGSIVKGVVVSAEGSGRVSGRAKMSLKLTQVQSGGRNYNIETNTLAMEAEGTTKRDAGRIAGAAALGTIIGAIAGGGSGAATGAVIGGGAGVGGTVLTKGKEVDLDTETLLSFKLMRPVKIYR